MEAIKRWNIKIAFPWGLTMEKSRALGAGDGISLVPVNGAQEKDRQC